MACSIVLFVIAAFEGISLISKRTRTGTAIGYVIDISMPAAETMKIYNSKWAMVSFNVGSENFISQNRIQVPMSSRLGDKVIIKYDIENPQHLITQTPKRLAVLISCCAISFIISLLLV